MEKYKTSLLVFGLVILQIILAGEELLASLPKELPFLDKIIIVSGSYNIPDDNSKLITYDENIYLFAVVKDARGNHYLGDDDSLPPRLKIGNKEYTITDESLKRWKKELWGPLEINWYRIMPRMIPSHPESEYKWYSNVFTESPDEGKFQAFAVIEYEQKPLAQKGWIINPKKGVGTHRFRVEVNYHGRIISSPGQEDPSQPHRIATNDYDKGIKPTVHRISRLSDHKNKLIRYTEALRGVPWCWGTAYKIAGKPDQHQADLANPISIECSDLIISALRAMGNKNLVYTSATELARGVYTEPMDERTFRLATLDIFKDWVPKGISFHSGFYYLCGKGKIKTFDLDFKTERDIESPSANYLDIAISKNGKIFLINETKNLEREIEILNLEGEVDSLYIFNLDGNLQEKIRLEKLYDSFVPVGSLCVKENLIYVPVYKKEVLVYNLSGKVVNRTVLPDVAFGLDVDQNRYYLAASSPFRIEIRRLDGTFVGDSEEKLIDQNGEDAVVRIGSSEDSLQVGDLILSGEEGEAISHTLVFYEDTNSNQFLDRFDKLIYAGHDGVMVSTVEEKLGSRYFILKRIDRQTVKID